MSLTFSFCYTPPITVSFFTLPPPHLPYAPWTPLEDHSLLFATSVSLVSDRLPTATYTHTATMGSTVKTVLLVGDQNDPFVQGIDYLYKQAETQPWLAAFLADNVAILKEQMTHWESTLRDTMGVFHTFQELADKYRTTPDPVGMSHGMLVFIMRQALLLQ